MLTDYRLEWTGGVQPLGSPASHAGGHWEGSHEEDGNTMGAVKSRKTEGFVCVTGTVLRPLPAHFSCKGPDHKQFGLCGYLVYYYPTALSPQHESNHVCICV